MNNDAYSNYTFSYSHSDNNANRLSSKLEH
jgi:hypothetical protein